MSILIKGIDMPKITGDFIQEKFVLLICPETGKAEFNDGKKWVDYEMQEVKTPHGRLIDADKLVVLQVHDENDNPVSPKFVPAEFIDEAETIIEAEEG